MPIQFYLTHKPNPPILFSRKSNVLSLIDAGGMPGDVYKERVYVDTLAMHVPAIKFAWEFMGVDHLIFGTDFPHRASGTVEGNLEILDEVGFSQEEKEKVLSKNSIQLFNLD